MIVSFGPQLFGSIGGGGPIVESFSACEKALPVVKNITTMRVNIDLQAIFIKLKYNNKDKFYMHNAV